MSILLTLIYFFIGSSSKPSQVSVIIYIQLFIRIRGYIVSLEKNKKRTEKAREANLRKTEEYAKTICPVVTKALELGLGNKKIAENLNAMQKFTRLGNHWTVAGIKRFRKKHLNKLEND